MKKFNFHGNSILIVDDMKLNFLVLKKTFEDFPELELHYVQDPREALNYLKNHSNINLILLDYEMPYLNGPDLCKQIKADSALKDIPIIFCTATPSQDTIELAFEAGADDYINKPICTPELLARMNRIFQNQNLTKMLEDKYQDKVKLNRLLSHDLNNYLSILHNSAYSLEHNQTGITESGKKALARISRAVERMSELVMNVRHLQALEDHKSDFTTNKTAIIDILKESIANYHEKIQLKNLQLDINNIQDSGNHYPLVWAEKTSALNSVFGNVISNAIKFSHKGDTIKIFSEKKDDNLVIAISDQGIGMDEELIQKVFNPSEKTSRPGTNNENGTGFGMPLVKSFMEQYGGKVELNSVAEKNSEPEHGTTVKLYFKIAS